uniref:hypothetical protein n=1 Tax=Holdemanella biformis TaxID=1735 RepID=UPI00402A40F5
MSWLDKIAKKRLAELEEHPELNEQNYSQKLNSIIFYILLFAIAILILLFWYDIEHFEIWIFPLRYKNSHNSGYNYINPMPTITP